MFCREMDSDNITAPCFPLAGLVWLSFSREASGFPTNEYQIN
ncbi:hypothetical protein SynRS9902_01166 [Synechococcus sp. RS9902]|nr:hypothetical protein SynRS9902_01166 [Synechococcus sp. RS9902]